MLTEDNDRNLQMKAETEYKKKIAELEGQISVIGQKIDEHHNKFIENMQLLAPSLIKQDDKKQNEAEAAVEVSKDKKIGVPVYIAIQDGKPEEFRVDKSEVTRIQHLIEQIEQHAKERDVQKKLREPLRSELLKVRKEFKDFQDLKLREGIAKEVDSELIKYRDHLEKELTSAYLKHVAKDEKAASFFVAQIKGGNYLSQYAALEQGQVKPDALKEMHKAMRKLIVVLDLRSKLWEQNKEPVERFYAVYDMLKKQSMKDVYASQAISKYMVIPNEPVNGKVIDFLRGSSGITNYLTTDAGAIRKIEEIFDRNLAKTVVKSHEDNLKKKTAASAGAKL